MNVSDIDLEKITTLAGLASMTWYFFRSSLQTLDKRLGEIVDRISRIGTDQATVAQAHVAEVKALADAHTEAVRLLSARNEALCDDLLELAREGGKRHKGSADVHVL